MSDEDELTEDVKGEDKKAKERKRRAQKYKKGPTLDTKKWARFADRHYKHYPRRGKIKYRKWELFHLIDWACEELGKEESLLELKPPLVLVGDIHGQYEDLLRIFMICNPPPKTRYLFLGDYVDRGNQGLECIALLLTYKMLYPDKIYLLRGNHECTRINQTYGFYQEVLRRFKDKGLWNHFQDAFDRMPVAALISDKILCMHGGLSPELNRIAQISQIEKPVHDPRSGIINDLLWSDPEVGISGWQPSPRKTSQVFGADVLKDKMDKLKIDLIVRAHQACQDGYRFFGNRKLVTIFSASNYCNESNNTAAVLKVTTGLVCNFSFFAPPPQKRRVISKQSLKSSSDS